MSGALQRVGAGDQAALRYIYDQTSAKLFGVCVRILQDKSEAEDVLQEVYVTVWRKAGVFDPTMSSPITWLVALARNRSIDRIRSSRVRQSQPIETAGDVEDSGALASDVVETEQEARRLHACVDELEPDHADHVRNAFMGGLTYQALAEQAGVPLGTMKSWIRRALIRLKACLER
ncbi:MAG: sigma-70 family RNA polymerase sigma factor [Caulobacteraceae bacterium]